MTDARTANASSALSVDPTEEGVYEIESLCMQCLHDVCLEASVAEEFSEFD